MSTTPVLDLSATSPPVSSTAAKQNKPGNDGASVFGQLLTKEMGRTQPQKTAARSAANTGERTASADESGWKSREASPSITTNSYTAEETHEVTQSDSQTPQTAPQTNNQEGAALAAAATAVQAAAIVKTEDVASVAGETSEAVFEISLEMLTGGELVEQPPPEIVQGPGVAVEKPPPQTTSPEPARLAEAQPETKLTSDQNAPQPITSDEFQRLLLMKQATQQTAPVTVQGGKEPLTAAQSEHAAPENGAQNALKTGSDQGVHTEQAAQPLNQPATQASDFLRSLQQYSQIKEVTFTQTAEAEVNVEVPVQQKPALPPVEAKQTEMAAPVPVESAPQMPNVPKVTASTQTVAEPVMVEKPLPEQVVADVEHLSAGQGEVQVDQLPDGQEQVQVRQPLPKQEKTEAEEPLPGEQVPEPQIEASEKTDQGSSTSAKVQNRPNISIPQGGQELQTQETPVENMSGQAKPVQAKVETAQEAAFKTNAGASSLQGMSESKSTNADSSQVSNEAANTTEQTQAPAILNQKTYEVSNKNVEAHTTAQRVVQQTFNQLEGMIQSGQKTLRVQLYPENLGHIELRVTSQNGSLQVVILADSSVTQQALQQHARDLQQTLQQSGVNLTGLTVGQRGDQEQSFSESYRAYQQQTKTNGRTASGEDIEQVDAGPIRNWSYLNPYTSMEYRV